MATNPRTLTWANPTQRIDGTLYAQADNAGYELSFDGEAAVSIPLAWGTSIDLTTIEAYTALKSGSHAATLRVVSKEGLRSEPSAATTFLIAVAPNPPTNLVLA